MARILGTDRTEILALSKAGHRSEAIVLAYSYSLHEIRQLLRFGAQDDKRARKIGPELAVAIRDAARQGESVASLAARLGVHRNSIGRVLAGRTWKE